MHSFACLVDSSPRNNLVSKLFVPLGTIDKKQNTASQLLNTPLNTVIFDHLSLLFY